MLYIGRLSLNISIVLDNSVKKFQNIIMLLIVVAGLWKALGPPEPLLNFGLLHLSIITNLHNRLYIHQFDCCLQSISPSVLAQISFERRTYELNSAARHHPLDQLASSLAVIVVAILVCLLLFLMRWGHQACTMPSASWRCLENPHMDERSWVLLTSSIVLY